jgi:hypothetical protein
MRPWFRKVAGVGLLVALTAGCATSAPPAATKEQRAKTLARAQEYCRKKGLVMRAGPADATPTRPGQAQPELQFRCVKTK